jgi:alpha-tubulin suppressor-like RCC1 family protein
MWNVRYLVTQKMITLKEVNMETKKHVASHMNLNPSCSTLAKHAFFLDSNGHLLLWGDHAPNSPNPGNPGPFQLPPSSSRPDEPTQVISVTTGMDHSLLLTTRHEVFSWGSNTNGELGIGDRINRYNEAVQVTLPTSKRIVQVGCGSGTSVALTEDGIVYTWGYNYYGQLGVGAGGDQLFPAQVRIIFGVCYL